MRLLNCRDCGEDIQVFEIPRPFTDPDRFRCIRCLDGRHADPPQLVLVQEELEPRRETRTYDPAQAAIPY